MEVDPNSKSEIAEPIIVPEEAVETEVETTNKVAPTEKYDGKEKNLARDPDIIKVTWSIPFYPVVEDDIRYSCTKCKYTCTRETLLKDHRAKVHGEKDLFKCPHCGYIGQLFKHLQKHMLRQHKIHLSSIKPDQERQGDEKRQVNENRQVNKEKLVNEKGQVNREKKVNDKGQVK